MVRIEERAGPTELRRTDRMRAIELAGSLAPGYALGDAIEYMEKVIREEAPNAQIIYNGETYQFKQRAARCGSRSLRAARSSTWCWRRSSRVSSTRSSSW